MTTYNTANTTPSAVSELVSASKEPNLQEPIVATIDSGPVQAYAKLEGEDFCYYIRTLQVSLGRKVTNPENVDIPLGHTKSVSRQHARLYYNFSTQRFELMVFGKNGAFVNEQFIERGVTVPLDNKTKIQIGEMAFIFLLPKSETVNNAVNVNNNSLPTNNDNNFGYISTPHQLEKNMIKLKLKPRYNNQSILQDDDEQDNDDLSDNGSELSDAINQYNSKDVKPPYSYASLIAQAINSCQEKKMTLNGIYNYITTNYPYYQMTQNGWQNSIRHNLSLNKAFVKVPRLDSEPGKGAFWSIDVNAETQFTNGIYKKKRTENMSDITNVKKKLKTDHTTMNSGDDDDNEEDEEVDELVGMGTLENVEMIEKEILEETTQSLLVADDTPASLHTAEANVSVMSIKTEDEKPIVIIEEKTKENEMVTVEPTLSTVTNITPATTANVNTNVPPEPTITPTINNDTQMAQEHLQQQLQNTIRQHLLDPVKYPLPPSIAQLLPQAIAQLPPQLATQLSSTIKVQKDTNTATDTACTPDSLTTVISPATAEAPTTTESIIKTESASATELTSVAQPTITAESTRAAVTAANTSVTSGVMDAIILPNDDDDIKIDNSIVSVKSEE